MDTQLVAAVEEHVHSELRDLVATSDLLLIGSRAVGFADSTSDYDVVLLTETDTAHEGLTFREHPRMPEISVVVLGPSARADKESANLPEWVYDITHARMLRRGTGAAVTYQGHLIRLWARRSAEEAARWRADAGAAVRLATSALRHDQMLAAHLALGRALTAVMKLIVTIGETGRPSDKWLPRVVSGLAPYGPVAVEVADRWCRAGLESDRVAAALDSLSAVMRELPFLPNEQRAPGLSREQRVGQAGPSGHMGWRSHGIEYRPV